MPPPLPAADEAGPAMPRWLNVLYALLIWGPLILWAAFHVLWLAVQRPENAVQQAAAGGVTCAYIAGGYAVARGLDFILRDTFR